MIRNSIIFVLLLCAIAYAQYPIYKSADLEQENTYWWLRKLNFHIQTDTLQLDDGQTTDTVYLAQKYPDLAYTVFVQLRWVGAAGSYYYAAPISDSSFQITKNTSDTSIVQWITFHD